MILVEKACGAHGPARRPQGLFDRPLHSVGGAGSGDVARWVGGQQLGGQQLGGQQLDLLLGSVRQQVGDRAAGRLVAHRLLVSSR